MKICTKCKVEKSLEQYSFDKRHKDHKQSCCKKCYKKYCDEHKEEIKEQAKKFPWKITFNNIKSRCNNLKTINYKYYGGRGIRCLITIDELKFLWFRDKAYNLKKASIDRKDDDGNYTYKNCRFIEKSENSKRVNQISKSKIINQYDLQGNFIKSWKNAYKIKHILGFSQGNISLVCNGKRKIAYKFIWRFN